MKGFSGRQTVLARWNVSDTINAFYACVDVNISGGSGTPNPQPTTPNPQPTTPRPTTPAPTTPPANPGSGTWASGTAYKVGDRVTYNGRSYQCRQAHTALTGWEPPNVAALWTAL